MPNSIQLTHDVASNGNFASAISRTSTLAELLELVPAPYRPRMQDLVYNVYRAAVKSNNARSYLATLEKHELDGDFPPEIGGRINAPALQISKEFQGTSEYKASQAEMDANIRKVKTNALKTVIALKKAELAHLQSLFAEDKYTGDAKVIVEETVEQLLSDAGMQSRAPDTSLDTSSAPAWIKDDYLRVNVYRNAFPARAIALAFMQVSADMSRKMRTLSLQARKVKEDKDKDVEMGEGDPSTDTVQSVVQRELAKLLKENKLQNVGMPAPASAVSVITADPVHRKEWTGEEKEQKNLILQEPSRSRQASLPNQESSRRERKLSRRKRERKEVEQEVAALSRPLLASSSDAGRVFLTRLLPGTLRVGNTGACLDYLSTNSELFCSVSAKALTQFVVAHTPISLLEHGHKFESGIFMGPGVVIPSHVEWQLAMNLKFIMHHPPNTSKVFEAWEHLQRSVRIAWHFRNSTRLQSKFYVPKSTWMPPADQWNTAIERGLDAGKDLLLLQATALTQSTGHRSNPDLRQLKIFLELNNILMKITDKNLGIAAISKAWYIEQCVLLLEDRSVYELITLDQVRQYQRSAIKRIKTICEDAGFSDQVEEFLLSSNTTDIPEFHAIPKVHKTQWKLRPIVPSHSWVTTKASEVCDFALRALHKRWFPWVVDSTREVIRQVESLTILRTDPVWVVTGDVESFYTNVDVQSTIGQLPTAMRSIDRQAGVDMDAIAGLATVVMNTNCFGFQGQYYHQKQGTAMGTSCAPSFANVCLGILEVQCPEIMDRGATGSLLLYVRYMDDILLIFKGSRTALQSCLDDLSTGLRPFKIGWEISSVREPRPFLDVEFFFDQGYGPVGLQTRVYRKRMNKHQYIPWSSAHPHTVKKAFIKAELTRFMIISSTKKLFEDRAQEFMKALQRRGYPLDTLRVWRKQVRYEDRSWSLYTIKDQTARGLPLMLPSSYDVMWEYIDVKSVFNAMKKSWVTAGEPLPPSLQGPLIKSLRRTDSLFDKLSSWNKAILQTEGEAGNERLLGEASISSAASLSLAFD